MTTDPIERLLRSNRPAETQDDGFTARTVAKATRSRLRIIGPLTVAAGSLVIATAAAATIQTVTQDPPVVPSPVASVLVDLSNGGLPILGSPAPKTPAPTRPPRPTPPPATEGTHASTSKDGLALDLYIPSNESELDTPNRARLVLTNVSDGPLVVQSGSGCPVNLLIAETEATNKDKPNWKSMDCVDPNNRPTTQEPTKFRLYPGESREFVSLYGFHAPGTYAVGAAAKVMWMGPSSDPTPAPTPRPLLLGTESTPGPRDSSHPSGHYRSGLFTGPLRVHAG